MDRLISNVDCITHLLEKFTLADAQYFLRPLCRAMNLATRRPEVRWVPHASLEAALERLRRRYDLGPTVRYYECVEALTQTLYALQLSGAVQFLQADPVHHGRIILGFYSIEVLDPVAWIQELLAVVRTHPAFQHPLAGVYAYQAYDPPCVAYAILRDLGLRPVVGTSIPPATTEAEMRNWIH
jgi:hypothetical protein